MALRAWPGARSGVHPEIVSRETLMLVPQPTVVSWGLSVFSGLVFLLRCRCCCAVLQLQFQPGDLRSSRSVPLTSPMNLCGVVRGFYEIDMGFYDIEVGFYEIDEWVYEIELSL